MSAADLDLDQEVRLVRSEALMAFRLASRLQQMVAGRHAEGGYVRESEGFFNYVRDVCNGTRAYCQRARDSSAKKVPEGEQDRRDWATDLRAIRDNLVRIRKVLVLLHPIVRDALSATTLKTPFALVVVMNALARRIVGEAQLLVTAAADYNYLHDRMMNLRLLKTGGLFPDFPRTLGLISFPHSEANGALHNCLLFHEVGHFLYYYHEVEKGLLATDKLSTQSIQQTLQRELGATDRLFSLVGVVLAPRVRSLAKKWANEVFADVVATEVLGPAHYYAFRHFLHAAPVPHERMFGVSHPAPLYRLALSWHTLVQNGWDSVVTELTPRIGSWASDHSFDEIAVGVDANVIAALGNHAPVYNWIVRWFHNEVMPLVKEKAREVVEKARAVPFDVAQQDAAPDDASEQEGAPSPFGEFYEAVREDLGHCVSPLNRKVLTEEYRERAPVFLLNSAFIYYLRHFPEWFGLFEDVKEASVQDAVLLYDRLDLLILKALDDLLLYWSYKNNESGEWKDDQGSHA